MNYKKYYVVIIILQCSLQSMEYKRNENRTVPYSKETTRYAKHTRKMPLSAEQIIAIQNGSKTVEGCVNTREFATIWQGDTINFFSSRHHVSVIVTSKHVYDSFEAMVDAEGAENLLPGTGKEEAVAFYTSIPGYAQKVKLCGAVGFRLRLKQSAIT